MKERAVSCTSCQASGSQGVGPAARLCRQSRHVLARALLPLLIVLCDVLAVHAAGHAEQADLSSLPCGVDAVVAMAQILDERTDLATIEEMTADYAQDRMTLLDVARELHVLTDTKPQALEACFAELLWLDRPHIIHLVPLGCPDCPEEGHVLAVERVTGDWAIVVHAYGTQLIGAEELRREYAGHALLAGPIVGPDNAPAIAWDSYVAELGNILAGQRRPCRLIVRNRGPAPLAISRVEPEPPVECLGASIQLAPSEEGEIELTICPRHRLDRAFDTRTYFVHVYSNDPIRPRTSVALRCTAVEPVIVKSPVVYFPRVTRSQPAERSIFVECRPPVELVSAIPSDSAVTAEVQEVGSTLSTTQYQLRLTVRSESLQPGVLQIPIALQLKGLESEGAELIARVRVWPE